MKIDSKDLVPMPPLENFRWGGHFYLLEGDQYHRVQFEDTDDRHARFMIILWLEVMFNEKRLFLNRCAPWDTFVK